jgi:hypothetical protein
MLLAAMCCLQVGSIVQQHAGAVDSLVSELLPIAVEYLAAEADDASVSSAAGPAVQQSQDQEQHEDYQCQNAQRQQLCQQVQDDSSSVVSRSHNGNSMLFAGLEQASVSQQLVDYSLAIAAAVPSADMARREFAWRNGWFLGRQVTPQHEQWLQRAGCQDLLLQYGEQ